MLFSFLFVIISAVCTLIIFVWFLAFLIYKPTYGQLYADSVHTFGAADRIYRALVVAIDLHSTDCVRIVNKKKNVSLYLTSCDLYKCEINQN